jgi:hypothetical protein
MVKSLNVEREVMKRTFVSVALVGLLAAGMQGLSRGAAAPRQGAELSYPFSDTPYPFRNQYPYTDGPLHVPLAHALLSVPDTTIRQASLGQHGPQIPIFNVDIRLYNDGMSSFYNVFWNRQIPLPGHIALYDARNHYVMDLTKFTSGSSMAMDWKNANGLWTQIPDADYVGAILSLTLPYPTYRVIPPGTYYLQVIYTSNAVVQPGDLNHPTATTDSDPETFRSNAVKITVEG